MALHSEVVLLPCPALPTLVALPCAVLTCPSRCLPSCLPCPPHWPPPCPPSCLLAAALPCPTILAVSCSALPLPLPFLVHTIATQAYLCWPSQCQPGNQLPPELPQPHHQPRYAGPQLGHHHTATTDSPQRVKPPQATTRAGAQGAALPV